MAGWFELSKSSDNQFRFVLKRAMVRLSSPASCIPQKPLRKKGIASVRSNSPQEERYEKKR